MDFHNAVMARLMQRGLVPGPNGAPSVPNFNPSGGTFAAMPTPAMGSGLQNNTPSAPVGNSMDPRGLMGILSRGSNVYNAGSSTAARSGSTLPSQGIGRPAKSKAPNYRDAAASRLQQSQVGKQMM